MENFVEFITAEGGMGAFVFALSCAVILDYFTGLAKAWHMHTLKSSVAKEGLIKKFALFAVVAACGLVDLVLPVETGYGICKLAALSFTISEVVSVAENAAAVGVPLPEALTKRLAQLTDSEDDDTRVS